MSKVLLLFDIDGTLLKSGRAGIRAMHQTGVSLFGQAFSLDQIEVSGHLDPLIYTEAVAINGLQEGTAKYQAFQDQYLDRLRQELAANRDQVRSLPGIDATLGMLRQRVTQNADVVLGLLTGNYTRAVPIKLTAVGIDPQWFAVTAFGDEGPDRPALVPVAMAKYQTMHGRAIDPGAVVIIGDTPRDVACAQAHGCVAFGVATGRFSTDVLREAGADVVVEDLADPGPLIELIDTLIAKQPTATT